MGGDGHTPNPVIPLAVEFMRIMICNALTDLHSFSQWKPHICVHGREREIYDTYTQPTCALVAIKLNLLVEAGE